MRPHILLLLPIALPLAACGGGEGSNITISGENGNVSIVTDADGNTSVSAPGVSGTISLPRINIDAADFNVNGVKLYPGSTVKDFNLDASGADERSGHLSIAFSSPASLDKVQAWFRDNFGQRGFKVSPSGNGFAGTTDKGDPITLELTADGEGKTTGKMTVGA